MHFLIENVSISIKISMKFFYNGPINNIPALVQIMAWCRPGDKPLSEPMMVSLLTNIYVIRPKWDNKVHVNSFIGVGDEYLLLWTELSLVQVKACRLACSAINHFLNQCWLVVSWALFESKLHIFHKLFWILEMSSLIFFRLSAGLSELNR